METIEIEVSKTSTEKKEISLPHYIKSGCHAHKVFSKTNALQVCYSSVDSCVSIGMVGISTAFHDKKEDDVCSEDEFNTLFNETFDRIKNLSKL